MKRILVILLCVALVLGCVACSSQTPGTPEPQAADPKESAAAEVPAAPAGDGDYKVGIVVAEYNEWNHLYYAMIEEKCKEYGWTSEVFDAAQDANQQINLVNSCVSQGFDAITIQPVDNAALAPSLIKAVDAGMVVISHYDYAADSDVAQKIYQVLFGQKDSGILEAQTYIDKVGETGKVALIGGLTGADNARLRSEGMREVFAKYPGIEIVDEKFCDWDRQKAMAAAQDIITAHPDLNAFIVQDDGMSWGVYEAIEAAGKTDQI